MSEASDVTSPPTTLNDEISRELRAMLARVLIPYVKIEGDDDPLSDVVNVVGEFFGSPRVLQLLHLRVENELIELRDARLSVMGPANGFVIKEYDGTDSSIMRMGTRDGLRVALDAFIGRTPDAADHPGAE